jgi:predicted ABC-type ATPase
MSTDLRARIASEERVLVVVAGPNGAGKSTFVESFLSDLDLHVVNPDVIARTLSPADPGAVAYEAAAMADGVRHDLLTRGMSFVMETVFSDPEGAKLRFLRDAQKRGYAVILIFIALDYRELAIARVIQRTEQGGHDVPDQKIVTRYPRTFANLREAVTFADHAFLFDNSSAEEPYRFVAEVRSGRVVRRGTITPRWWRDLRERTSPE